MLQSDDDTNTYSIDVVPKPIDDDEVEIPPPSHEEVKVAITRLENIERQALMASPLNCLKPDVMSW